MLTKISWLEIVLLREYNFFMKEVLYHGSDKIIEEPKFGFGRINNDYGCGFYCTGDFDLAGEWAVSLDRDGYVNEYSLNMEDLSVLDLNGPEYCILDWLVILLENRRFDVQSDFGSEAQRYLKNNFSVDYRSFDIIRGYRADDSYFSFAQDFLNNTISLTTLEKALKLGGLGEQTVLVSNRAFGQIDFVRHYKAQTAGYYPAKENRDNRARDEYRRLRNEPWRKGELYLMQIIDRELKRDDLFV